MPKMHGTIELVFESTDFTGSLNIVGSSQVWNDQTNLTQNMSMPDMETKDTMRGVDTDCIVPKHKTTVNSAHHYNICHQMPVTFLINRGLFILYGI